MKPIFKEEKEFLEKHLDLKLPEDCWRDGKSIYLNSDTKTKIIVFTIENKKIKIKKNNIEDVLKKYKNKTINDEIQENNTRLDQLLSKSISRTIECIKDHPGHILTLMCEILLSSKVGDG